MLPGYADIWIRPRKTGSYEDEDILFCNCNITNYWVLTLNIIWIYILKEISPGCSLEGMMLKLKLQYFGYLMRRIDSLEKTDAGRNWGQEEKGTTEDEMAGWHHQLNAHEFGWTPGVGDRQGGLVCCNSWGHKESDTTEWLNWAELHWTIKRVTFCPGINEPGWILGWGFW